jgi:hypothetical protein
VRKPPAAEPDRSRRLRQLGGVQCRFAIHWGCRERVHGRIEHGHYRRQYDRLRIRCRHFGRSGFQRDRGWIYRCRGERGQRHSEHGIVGGHQFVGQLQVGKRLVVRERDRRE